MRQENYCDFVAGCFGGACGVVIGHPLDTIKTWQQASNSSVTSAVRQIYNRNNGWNGFYRGMLFPFITTGAVNSILFGVYGNVLRPLRKVCHSDYQREQLEYHNIFIAGSMAGFLQSFVACPVELIKVRLQTQHFYNNYTYGRRHTPLSMLRKIVKIDGIFGLYRGLLPTMCRDVLPNGIYMLTYKWTMDFLALTNFGKRRREEQHMKNQNQPEKIDILIVTLAGAFSGIISWVCVIPFDVVKTLMQAEESGQYRNIRHCLVQNFKAYGWRSIFRGSWMLVVRAVPCNAAAFLGYEYALQWCHNFQLASNIKV